MFEGPVPASSPTRPALSPSVNSHATPPAQQSPTESSPKKPFLSRDISPYSGMFDGAPGPHQGPNGVYRDSERTAQGSLSKTSASGSLGIGETIGLHGQA